MKKVEFSELNGLTITKIDGLNRLSEKVTIHTKEGRVFEMKDSIKLNPGGFFFLWVQNV